MPDARVDTIIRGGQVVTSSQVYEGSIAIVTARRLPPFGPEQNLLPPADNYIDA